MVGVEDTAISKTKLKFNFKLNYSVKMKTYFSCASSFAVLDFVHQVLPEDLSDGHRPPIFLDGSLGILDVDFHLSLVLILNHLEI